MSFLYYVGKRSLLAFNRAFDYSTSDSDIETTSQREGKNHEVPTQATPLEYSPGPLHFFPTEIKMWATVPLRVYAVEH